MAKQAVDTERVTASAAKIRTADNAINSAFKTLQNKAKQLDNSWNSAAGTTAKTTMYQLFQSGAERSKVLQNYVNMLTQQVNPGYADAETANTTLADKFM